MTVCIASFAEKSKAIVMLSDKAVTYASGLQSDTGVTKLRRIGDSGWHVLIAGNPTFALKVINAAEGKLAEDPTPQGSLHAMMDCLGQCYQNVRDKAVDDAVLRPNLLTRELLVSRPRTLLPLHDDLVISMHESASRYRVRTSLLVCGFDSTGGPHIFSVTDPGTSDNFDMTGFHAVGIGAQTAIAENASARSGPRGQLPLALYQAFDAKVNAEIMQGVGYGCDAAILVRGQNKRSNVPRAIIRLIDNVFMSHPNTPFKSEDRLKAPRLWNDKLNNFASHVMGRNARPRR